MGNNNPTEEITNVKPKTQEISETTENYLKRILWLFNSKNEAKVSEIAKLMGRSLSSTTEAMQRLAKDNFINYERYGKIELTEKGKKVATKINDAYRILAHFLELLGIPKDTAHEDACSMEHAISTNTIDIIAKFVDFIEKDPVNSALIEKFSKNIIENY